MKKNYFFLILLLPLFNSIYSQDILWEKSYGGKFSDCLFDAQPTADYGFILAGSSLSGKTGNKTDHNNGNLDYCVWKMSENGDIEWQKSFGGNGIDLLQSVKVTNDGGFILAGTSNSFKTLEGETGNKKEDCKGNSDFWVIKLDAKGEEIWQKTIGGNGQDELICAFQSRDGGYMLGGSSSSSIATKEISEDSEDVITKPDLYSKSENSRGNMDYWIVKLDKAGTIQWQKTYGGEYADFLRSMEQTKDGGYILGGYSNSPKSGEKEYTTNGIGDFWILKISDTGEIEWQKTLGGEGDNQLYAIHQTQDLGYIVGGNSNSTIPLTSVGGSVRSGTDFWVLKLEENGTISWSETYDYGKIDILTSLVENKDATYLIGGHAQSENANSLEKNIKKDEEGINDYIALKISDKGERLWDKTVGSKGEDILRKLIETRDGGFLLAGTSNPVNNNGIGSNKTSNSKNSSPINIGSGGTNKQLQKATNSINYNIKELNDNVNELYKEKTQSVSQEINNAIGLDKDSPVKFGSNAPENLLNNNSPLSTGDDSNGLDEILPGAQKQNIPVSRDKHTNLGNNDFWVVKIKDKQKPIKPRTSGIEVIPNPAASFTNIIIGYDFENGTATLVDMAGRTLQQFSITSRTVPVDLSRYSDGVYIVNIKTNVQSDGVKVIKKGLN